MNDLFKFSISIDGNIDFDTSYTKCYIEINKLDKDNQFKKINAYPVELLDDIIKLVHNYIKLHKQELKV